MKMMINIPKYMKWAKSLSLLVSGLITAAILLTFWSWLVPATFWQKVTGLILSIAGGAVILVFIYMLCMLLVGIIVARRMRGKMAQQFMGQLGESSSEDNEETEESNDVMYG